ncbi:MAG TPA: hypothetical protein VNN20_17465 [Thermodesulfobacteriota bacterium]|nr:hypothetical protein [Thermodesulfobacteriota bacterium]
MKNLIFIFPVLFLMVLAFSSPAQEDDYDSALARLEELENRLINIKNDGADIPDEELDKASEWIETARGALSQDGLDPMSSLMMEKASCQVDYLNALLEESKSKKKVDEIEELIQKIRSQTEEIKTTNLKVKEEINNLEQK